MLCIRSKQRLGPEVHGLDILRLQVECSIASVQGTPFPHQENAPATLNDPAAAAPAPAAAEVATKVRPFITPINPDKYDIRL